MDSNYLCVACETQNLLWRETVVEREDASGIQERRKRVLSKSRDLRDQLCKHFQVSNAPIWIAVQNRAEQDDEDQYWVGKALRVEKVHTERGTVGRNRYDAGDVEFAVQWYERDISGGDERRIFTQGMIKEKADTFNSTELRAIHVPMQLIPPVGGVPLDVVALRLPRRAASRCHPHVRTALHAQHAEPPNTRWEILSGDERHVLDWCV
eukprot:CAMPEP_0182838076 /NCGR_PEP_ID=MMETSP0006_2-20121128/23096_1 /TAXON_ID=97485 /ORGANISM="Prymnesium parvum, Strain Texoma1" /LENGTH=208 /DNA_ID=CAMNT_0024967047 /DNA_START=353 /DNA_END=979 /DNA_ORIENTATION=-